MAKRTLWWYDKRLLPLDPVTRLGTRTFEQRNWQLDEVLREIARAARRLLEDAE